MKNIIITSVAFLLGGFIGYKVCEKQLAETYRQDLESVIQRMTKYDTDNVPEGEEDNATDEAILFTKQQQKEQNEKVNVDYSKFAKPSIFDYAHDLEDKPDEEEEDDDDDDDDDLTEEPQEDEENEYDPYLILEEEYHYSMDHNGDDGQLLFYYVDDQVVCEEDDSVVDDYYKILGYDFEEDLNVNVKTWVRNANLRTVYEVHRIDKSYAETVSTLAETPQERTLRRAGRMKEAKDA